MLSCLIELRSSSTPSPQRSQGEGVGRVAPHKRSVRYTMCCLPMYYKLIATSPAPTTPRNRRRWPRMQTELICKHLDRMPLALEPAPLYGWCNYPYPNRKKDDTFGCRGLQMCLERVRQKQFHTPPPDTREEKNDDIR